MTGPAASLSTASLAALLDFSPTQSGNNAATVNTTAACWDDATFVAESLPLGARQGWLLAYFLNDTIIVASTAGDGLFGSGVQTELNDTPFPANDIVVDATGNIWVSAQVNSTTFGLWNLGGGSSPGSETPNEGTVSADYSDCQIAQAPATSGSAIYFAVGSTLLDHGVLGNCTAAGVITNAQLAEGAHWLLVSNGSFAVAVNKSAVSQLAWKSNAAGSAWTSSTIGLGSGDVPTALCWSPALQIFVLCVCPGDTGGSVTFWTSPDGVNWTNTGTTLENLYTGGKGFYGIEAIGTALLAVSSDLSTTVRLWVSLDGAVTWYPTTIAIGNQTTDQIAFTGLTPAMAGGPSQVLIGAFYVPPISGGSVTTNAYVRFSAVSGLGDQPQT